MSQAARTFTDQLGRQVTVPDTVDRVVVLQHQTLNLLVQMNATDKIVGVMANWKQQLGDGASGAGTGAKSLAGRSNAR